MSILDKLPKNIPFLSKPEESEYYFALIIGFSHVTASVWGIERGKLEILSSSTQPYHSDEDLTEASNYALDEALGSFQPEPEQVLFGVPETWLMDENIKPEYLKTLRQMVKDLGLQPMAYVSTAHALSHLLTKEQGSPIAAVLVENDNPLVVSVAKGGKIVGSKRVKRTDNLPQDIEKALLSFSDIEVLPSKIVVFGGDGKPDTPHVKEELQSFSWMAHLPFLHLPKIDLLPADAVLEGICYAGASELNPSVVFHPKHHNVAANKDHKNTLVNHLDDEEEHVPVRGHRAAAAGAIGAHHANIGPVGEMEETEIHHERGEDESHYAEASRDEETARFALDEDLPPTHNLPVKRGEARRHEMEEYEEEVPQHHVRHSPEGFGGGILGNLLSFLPFGKGGAGGHHPSAGVSGGIKGLLTNKFLIGFVVLILLLGVAFVVVPKAKVSVFIDMQVLQKDSTIIADPAIASVDEGNRKIPGTVVEVQVDGSLKGNATGKKQVGESAKGTVIIYNKTNSPKTFNAGTVLQGETLEFTLDSSVQVASQSAFETGISFGKATVNATATEIGPEGNLQAGKELSIKDQSTNNFSAKVDQAFSGGVSKDVTVVTAEDQRKLLAQLSGDLRTKAKEQIQTQVSSKGLKIIEEGLTEQIASQVYSKKVGDQTSDFTLNMTAKYKGTAYNEQELKTLVSKLLDTNVPEGFVLDLAQSETQSEISKVEKDGRLVFTAKFKAKLKPKIDEEQLKKQLTGMTEDQAKDKVKEIGNVIGSDVVFTPNLPGPLRILPFLSQNITLEVMAK